MCMRVDGKEMSYISTIMAIRFLKKGNDYKETRCTLFFPHAMTETRRILPFNISC